MDLPKSLILHINRYILDIKHLDAKDTNKWLHICSMKRQHTVVIRVHIIQHVHHTGHVQCITSYWACAMSEHVQCQEYITLKQEECTIPYYC